MSSQGHKPHCFLFGCSCLQLLILLHFLSRGMGGFSSKAGCWLQAALEGKNTSVQGPRKLCLPCGIDHKASATSQGKGWAGAFAVFHKKTDFPKCLVPYLRSKDSVRRESLGVGWGKDPHVLCRSWEAKGPTESKAPAACCAGSSIFFAPIL